MNVLLGAIADDFTGATDLCNTLVRRGMRTVQLIDVPGPGAEVADAEAVVVALKSRTIPVTEAIEKSLGGPENLTALTGVHSIKLLCIPMIIVKLFSLTSAFKVFGPVPHAHLTHKV